MLTVDVNLQVLLDILGVFVFALSGGLVAVRKGLDLVGVVVLAWVAGLGGGIMRDVLLGATPPVGISDWRLLASVVVAGALTFLWQRRLRSAYLGRARGRMTLLTRSVRTLDAVGLAFFAVSGSLKALDYDTGALAAVLLGVLTAVGGGALRDVLAGQVPEVLRRELYAVPALIGASVVVLADRWGHLNPVVIWGSVMLVFAIRMAAVALNLNAPTALRTTGETQ
ncbi:trimeric intracellular cation channel family protein [Ornithinimicrobium cryptoxanthini]|uniref:Trimeric intracellular cation channel family protein n=1 Tax=Ornithinimicrobium cryptoxanthini TaxID=2934161 RepID=A0ABY4YLM5_9MICO|nr:trimeric intracellular cation channel family protein [Ornithinimicrobium cryptoxanthini]USQ77626.1 trimeric intracellular cation channel family protein [Ornithinimicrobium cryptoxanthini]